MAGGTGSSTRQTVSGWIGWKRGRWAAKATDLRLCEADLVIRRLHSTGAWPCCSLEKTNLNKKTSRDGQGKAIRPLRAASRAISDCRASAVLLCGRERARRGGH